ncbi:MAG: right-handed parallel beta-helix repeat-containing protein, partial [Candidatus Heimdallarchaeaceae archaeon]
MFDIKSCRKKIIPLTMVIVISSFLIPIKIGYNQDFVVEYHSIRREDYNSDEVISLNYIPHESIEITSDDNFTDYGFAGIGTIEDPFIIENYSIIKSDLSGILIAGTTKYFIIRDCNVEGYSNGIYLDSVSNGTAKVLNNTCDNNGNYGIYLYNSNFSLISNNFCSQNNGVGIYLENSEYCSVISNDCSYNNHVDLADDGISLLNSGFTEVSDNICNHNRNNGISIFYSSSVEIYNNTCS